MAEKTKTKAIPNPYDMEAKRQIHPLADEKNFIDEQGILRCGAKKRRGTGFCRSVAGAGTKHLGYGRCKFCGGMNTGPKTPEGKEKTAQNSKKHGFYSAVLGKEEKAAYEGLLEKDDIGLKHEIYMLKAKILVYLKKWYDRFEAARSEAEAEGQDGIEAGEKATKVHYRIVSESDDGETISNATMFYHAATIEDKPLMRALETLGRLIEKHARLTQDNGDNLLNSINQELKAASHGQVNISWGGKAQERVESPTD